MREPCRARWCPQPRAVMAAVRRWDGLQCWDKATNTGSGCTQTHMSPDGMVLARAANYSKPHEAVVQSWRGGGTHIAV